MPTRILRDGILSSKAVDQLDYGAEVFYRRMMSVVDDFGRFTADPMLIRADCYPRRTDSVTIQDIERWLDECGRTSPPLLRVYEVNGEKYLEILKFGQRIRTFVSRFPVPPGEHKPEEFGERDFEEELVEALTGLGLQVQRQLRVGSGYADIVIEQPHVVIEVKRTRLTPKAAEQVLKYAGILGALPCLYGFGLAASFLPSEYASRGLAVVSCTLDGAQRLVADGGWLTQDSPLWRVISREITQNHTVCESMSCHAKSREMYARAFVSVSDSSEKQERVESAVRAHGRTEAKTQPNAHMRSEPYDLEAAWQEFRKTYPVETEVDAALQWYISGLAPDANLLAEHSAVMEGLRVHLASAKWRNRETGELELQFVPSMARFLGVPSPRDPGRGRMYRDRPPPWRPPSKRSRRSALEDMT